MTEQWNKAIAVDLKQYLVTLQIQTQKEFFQITPQGEIERDGVQITDEDSAVADMLRALLLQSYGLKIRPAVRRVSE